MREQEQPADTVRRAIAREEPGVREHETEQRAEARVDPVVQEHESLQQAIAREDPVVRARESRQRAVAQGKKTHEMACKCVHGEYLFHQPCGLWNEPCVYGCGYIHLSNSTPGTRKKCCINGRLSSASANFDEDLMMGYVLDELPSFVRKVISSGNKFSQKSSTYNNLVAMAATVVCNYNETAGFTRHGPGPQSVFVNGHIHHYMRIASSASQNCCISYFIFDDIASLAWSADAQNIAFCILHIHYILHNLLLTSDDELEAPGTELLSATWLAPCGCHSLLSVTGDLLAPAKSRADIVVAVVVIRGGCGRAIIEIEVVERIVSLAFRDVRSTSLGKGPHRDSQDVAIVAVEQPFIPFADRVGFEAFIAIARHCVIDRRQELHSVQFAFCKVVIQIDMIGAIEPQQN